jgi:excisionase family DNA binding protein
MNNIEDRISKAWIDGYTSTEIAKMLSLSTRYVFYVAHERKLKAHKSGRPRKTR